MYTQQKLGLQRFFMKKIRVAWKYTNFYRKIIIWSWDRRKLPGYVEKRFPPGNDDE